MAVESIGSPVFPASLSLSPISEQTTGQQTALPFKAGQLFHAVVVENQANQQLLLDTPFGRFNVATELKLVKGQSLEVRVASLSPQLELALSQDPVQSKLKSLLPALGRSLSPLPLAPLLEKTGVEPGGQTRLPLLPQSVPMASPPVTGGGGQLQSGFESLTAASDRLLEAGSPGRPVRAVMIERISADRALIDIGGRRVEVRGDVEARPGQTVILQPQSTKRGVAFALVSQETGKPTGQLLVPVGKGIETAGFLKGVEQPLTPATVSTEAVFSAGQRATIERLLSAQPETASKKEWAARLALTLRTAGMDMEALVARGDTARAGGGLKAALLAAFSSSTAGEELQRSAGNLLSTLELFQVAQLRLEGEALIFPLPFSFLENGFLVVDHFPSGSSDDDSEEQSTSLALYLKMDELGDVEVHYLQTRQGARIRFLFDSDEKAGFAADFQQELEQFFEETKLLGISFSGGATSPETALMEKMKIGDHSVISTAA
ncbi:MAG: hypothetical protein ABFS19_03965 [Thermodesulfobacteriota bacterium]